MKPLALWSALFAVVVAAASLAMAYLQPASSAVQKIVAPGALSPRHAYLGGRRQDRVQDDRCDSGRVIGGDETPHLRHMTLP